MPENKDTIPTSIRLPVDLKGKLEAAAAADDRTLNNLILVILKRWIRDHEEN